MIATGLATPVGAAVASATVVVATSTLVPHRPRAIPVDRLLGWRLASLRLRALSLIATWAGASAIMARRRKVLCRENERFPAGQSPGARPDPQAASPRKLAQPAPQSSGDRP